MEDVVVEGGLGEKRMKRRAEESWRVKEEG
jgi:hypothetical protein